MSDFLVNVVRRGAGTPPQAIVPPAPVPDFLGGGNRNNQTADDLPAALIESELIGGASELAGVGLPNFATVTAPTLVEPALIAPESTRLGLTDASIARGPLPTDPALRNANALQDGIDGQETSHAGSSSGAMSEDAHDAPMPLAEPAAYKTVYSPNLTSIPNSATSNLTLSREVPEAPPLTLVPREQLSQVLVEPREPRPFDTPSRVVQLPIDPERQPVQVRIGTIEVRVTKPPSVPAAQPVPSTSVGFDAYHFVRNYLDRGW
jgi:hypothetical protein